VFVGIYWLSYGWVAPGTAISGIEDEFELGLGHGKPMLLYVTEPAEVVVVPGVRLKPRRAMSRLLW